MAESMTDGLMRTKPIDRLRQDAEGSGHALERTIGPLSLIGLGIGAIIGAGLFSLTGIARRRMPVRRW